MVTDTSVPWHWPRTLSWAADRAIAHWYARGTGRTMHRCRSIPRRRTCSSGAASNWPGFARRSRTRAPGPGTVVLVAGDAGIGKTRLVAELSTRAGATGARELTGRCLNLVGGGLPYLPFAEAFRAFANAPLPAGTTGAWVDTTEPPGATNPQLLLFDRVRTFLEDLSVTAPVVLVVKDLHWADLPNTD